MTDQQCWILDYYDNELGKLVHGHFAYSLAAVAEFQFRCLRHGDTPMVKPYSAFVRSDR